MFAQLAVDAAESKFHEAYAKYEQVHEQLELVTKKHDALVAARRAGDTSERAAAALYSASLDLAALQALAASAPVRGQATTEREFLARAKADLAKQKNDVILDLARDDIARVENAFIERVRGLDTYARSNRLVNGGSIFSVFTPGQKIGFMMRTNSLPPA